MKDQRRRPEGGLLAKAYERAVQEATASIAPEERVAFIRRAREQFGRILSEASTTQDGTVDMIALRARLAVILSAKSPGDAD